MGTLPDLRGPVSGADVTLSRGCNERRDVEVTDGSQGRPLSVRIGETTLLGRDAVVLAGEINKSLAERRRLVERSEKAEQQASALWTALLDIKATCDGRVAGEQLRASYLGISNYINDVLREHAPVTTPADDV